MVTKKFWIPVFGCVLLLMLLTALHNRPIIETESSLESRIQSAVLKAGMLFVGFVLEIISILSHSYQFQVLLQRSTRGTKSILICQK